MHTIRPEEHTVVFGGRDLWVALTASVVGFTAFLVLDIPWVYRRSRLTWLFAVGGSLLLAEAFHLARRVGPNMPVPRGWQYVGWGILVMGAIFTLFVVFVEIPWRLRCAGQTANLVTSGTYAACRHPGFWGILLLALGSVLSFPRVGMLILGGWWIFLEFVLVWVQDRQLLPRRFPAYRAYQQQTPFLIPSRQSLQRARRTWKCRPSLSRP